MASSCLSLLWLRTLATRAGGRVVGTENKQLDDETETNAFEYSNYLLCQTGPGGTFRGGMLNCIPFEQCGSDDRTSVPVINGLCTQVGGISTSGSFLSQPCNIFQRFCRSGFCSGWLFSSISAFVWSVNTGSCRCLFLQLLTKLHSHVQFRDWIDVYAEKRGGLSVSGVNLQFTAVLIGFPWLPVGVWLYFATDTSCWLICCGLLFPYSWRGDYS